MKIAELLLDIAAADPGVSNNRAMLARRNRELSRRAIHLRNQQWQAADIRGNVTLIPTNVTLAAYSFRVDQE